MKIRKEYYEELKINYEQVRTSLIKQAEDQEINIDEVYEQVEKWIEEAALKSIWVMTFNSKLNDRYWTEEMEKRRSEMKGMESAYMTIIKTTTSPAIKKAAARNLLKLNQEYRYQLAQRRTDLFQEIVTDLGDPQNSGAFLRMVKNIKARKNISGCQLEKDKLEEHVAYFENTFATEGQGQKDEAIMDEEDAIEFMESGIDQDDI